MFHTYLIFSLQLVIEPLRALIQSQISDLRSRGITAESLLSKEDSGAVDKLRAKDRLTELSNMGTKQEAPARLLFCTPEMFTNVIPEVKHLVSKRLISLIVVDEFDVIEDASTNYRGSYLTLVDEIRSAAPTIQLLLLSATFSRKCLTQLVLSKKINLKDDGLKPHLYLSKYPLPENHIFSGKDSLVFFCKLF